MSPVLAEKMDGLLRVWDLRATGTASATAKMFLAGVTYTRWLDDKTIITGSYDQFIRLLDTRNMKESLKEIETTGGVWHIEQSSFDGETKNLAMYGGWSLFDADFNLLKSDEAGGKQLLYGATMVSGDSICYATFKDYVTLSNV